MHTKQTDWKVDAARLERSLADLGRIGETPDGMQRIAFSPAELEAREFTAELMRRAGMTVRVDAGGNLIGRREGAQPEIAPIAMGSHIDAVPRGGKYDGALGVMAGIEVCWTLSDRDYATRHPLEVIAFTNEEGAFLHRGLLGSRAMAGLLEEADLTTRDEQGRGYADVLPSVGGDGGKLASAVRAKGDLACYLELHVEQGPYLFRSGNQIGVTTGITGRAVFEIRVRGFGNHAGTTPMDGRQDALVAAARVIQAVEAIAGAEGRTRVGTVGTVRCLPGAINVIPGEVVLGAEFRDLEMNRMSAAEDRLRELCVGIARDREVEIQVVRTELEHATPTHPEIRGVIEAAARRLGYTTEPVPSGAGHDAQAIATFADIGMIFVPSKDGISHSPKEYSSPEDCARGADVLLHALLELDAARD